MRLVALLCLTLLLAACGDSSSASVPTVIPTNTPFPHKSWTSPPPMTINKNGSYAATVDTTDGTFVIQLLPRIAPFAVNNFIFLARQGYYRHVLFHRIIPNFMIQTGDPTGTGMVGPGYTISDEPVHGRYTPGTVAMARTSQANSAGSEFFITVTHPYAQLAPNYTIFGRVISGMNVVNKIASTPVGQDPASQELSYPLKDVFVNQVTIH